MAAGPAARRLGRSLGFEVLDRPAYFLVEDVQGPLAAGELERAVAWGRRLGVLSPASRRARRQPQGVDGTRHSTVVPRPAVEVTSRLPPCLSARSRMLPSPLSRTSSAKPRPSSVTDHQDVVADRDPDVHGRRVGVPARVGQRLAEDREQVGRDLRRDERPHRALDGERRPELQRRRRPVDEPGHLRLEVRGVGQRAEREDRAPDVLDGAVQVVDGAARAAPSRPGRRRSARRSGARDRPRRGAGSPGRAGRGRSGPGPRRPRAAAGPPGPGPAGARRRPARRSWWAARGRRTPPARRARAARPG